MVGDVRTLGVGARAHTFCSGYLGLILMKVAASKIKQGYLNRGVTHRYGLGFGFHRDRA